MGASLSEMPRSSHRNSALTERFLNIDRSDNTYRQPYTPGFLSDTFFFYYSQTPKIVMGFPKPLLPELSDAASASAPIRVLSWLKLLSITFQVNDTSISLDRQSRPTAVDCVFNVVSIMEVVYR